MNKKLIKIFKNICKTNNQIIAREKKSFTPVCVIIDKKYDLEIIGLIFKTGEQKRVMRELLLKRIAEQEVKGYITVLDTKMTIHDDNGFHSPQDASVRTLYTPNEEFREITIYEDGKIIKKINPKCDRIIDEWNLWGEHFNDGDMILHIELSKFNSLAGEKLI